MTTFYIYPHKSNPNVIPHRKFHPNSDYLHILKVCAPNGWANQIMQNAQDRNLVVNSNEETNRNPQTRRPTRVNARSQQQLQNIQKNIKELTQQARQETQQQREKLQQLRSRREMASLI